MSSSEQGCRTEADLWGSAWGKCCRISAGAEVQVEEQLPLVLTALRRELGSCITSCCYSLGLHVSGNEVSFPPAQSLLNICSGCVSADTNSRHRLDKQQCRVNGLGFFLWLLLEGRTAELR